MRLFFVLFVSLTSLIKNMLVLVYLDSFLFRIFNAAKNQPHEFSSIFFLHCFSRILFSSTNNWFTVIISSICFLCPQVMHWRSKVDRSVIEHVRAFTNPPVLVGQVIEMVMVLIGKRLPSQRIAEVRDGAGGNKEDLSSRMSSSSGSQKLAAKKGETQSALCNSVG